MDTRSSALRIVASLFLVMILPSVCFPDTVHIYGGEFNLPLSDPIGPGSAMTEATIEIPDHLVITDLDVRINITHTNVFDLQILLQRPDSNGICLNMYDPYSEFFVGENYTNTVFDDEAALSIKQAEAPFTGRFRPVEPYKLSKFDGQDTYGLWRLQIHDMWPANTGTLNSFELMISTPEPASAILLALGVCLTCLRRRHGGR